VEAEADNFFASESDRKCLAGYCEQQEDTLNNFLVTWKAEPRVSSGAWKSEAVLGLRSGAWSRKRSLELGRGAQSRKLSSK